MNRGRNRRRELLHGHTSAAPNRFIERTTILIERQAGSVETIKEGRASFPIFGNPERLYILALRIASAFPSADESPFMYVPDPSPTALASHLRKTTASDEVAAVFLGDAHRDTLSEWERLGAETDCPVVVGLFPGVVEDSRWHRGGAVVLSVPVQGRPQVLDLTGPLPDPTEGGAAVSESSFLVLVDGLSSYVGKALSWLRDRCGTERICVGGGAGRRSMTPGPCLVANETRWQDAAVVIPLAGQVDLGVRHGWTRTGTSLIATRTDGTVIEHLNWEPAAEVYARAVEAHQGAPVAPDAFAETAARHPFGLLREGREDIVRDPVARTDNGGIRCAGPVPENTVLHVLEGNADALIDAAGQVRAGGEPSESIPDTVFVADCVSRQLYLNDRMDEELEAIAAGGGRNDPTPYGVLSIGEIACDGTGHLEWLNKTTVRASFSTSSEGKGPADGASAQTLRRT